MSSASPQGAGQSVGTPGTPKAERGPNCFQCKHFAISWQPSMPYACRLLGFKSKVLPAIEVMRIDGRKCLGFAAKPLPPSATSSAKKSVNTFA